MFLLHRLLSIAALAVVCHGSMAPAGRVEERWRHTKRFDLTITWEDFAPDGFARKMLLVNGQSPAPTLEIEEDDWVVVQVFNESPFETSVHFHGIEQINSPWSDGVPGVTQRPIPPGGRFTHRFRALQYGSYWYHSHARFQIEDGFYGAIVVHPRRERPRPFHLISQTAADVAAMRRAERHVRPLILYDYMHLTSEERLDITPRAGVETSCYDSVLFNGKGQVTCLPEEVMMANLSPVQRRLLDGVPGAKLTDKGCLPAIVMATFGGNLAQFNESALPPGLFSGCKPSRSGYGYDGGRTEVIRAHEPAGDNSWIAFDIIGSINFINGAVAIDDHDMWVYAMDGAYIQPQKVQALRLANAERYSVMVKLRRGGRFKVRFHSMSAPQTLIGHAILHVPERGEEWEGEGAYEARGNAYRPSREHRQWIDLIGRPLSPDVVFFDQTRAHPFPPVYMAPTAEALHVLNMRAINGTTYLWALNFTSLYPTELERVDPPVLYNVAAAGAGAGAQARGGAFRAGTIPARGDNVTIVTRNDTWIDLVFRAADTPMPAHPIHKHGVKMFLLGSGTGPFPWSSIEQAARERPGQFNLVDPPRRDGVLSLATAQGEESWVAVRYHSSNPGPWLMHCHIANHMIGGMMMVILDGVDAWPRIP
ncbi:hypothetical protein E4U21_004096 [Claviceps maximensis]|nr:hypothetical protein E4U21_004096 [Claviceps maximensis]